MSGFVPTVQSNATLDPRKRVNYRLGLVLGEDEFRQDQFHHRERDHQASRALHGYGTVSGLAVGYDAAERRLSVASGLAVDPVGRLICVPVEYCADIDNWLRTHAESDEVSGGLPASIPVFVVLCWTECETDDVPIPADSCLSEDQSRAASRLMDGFELRLVTERPPLVGEIAPGSPDGLPELVDELRGVLDAGGSPPDDGSVAALLRAWAVDRRPEVIDERACLTADGDACVLLAELTIDVDVDVSGTISAGAVDVDDSDRPILVSTRFLQEALLALHTEVAAADHLHNLGELDDVDLSTLGGGGGEVLTFDGAAWVPNVPGGGGGDHGGLAGLGGDDHPQYLRTDGARALTGSLSAGGNRITDQLPSAAGGQSIVQGQNAGGDLTQQYPNPRIAAIQGVRVDAPAPAEGDALILRSGQWVPTRPTLLPFASIEPAGQGTFTLWFNIDGPRNREQILTPEGQMTVQRETETGTFLATVNVRAVARRSRNIFTVALGPGRLARPFLRFGFLLDGLLLESGMTLTEWAQREGIWFDGQSEVNGRRTVTKFVIDPNELG